MRYVESPISVLSLIADREGMIVQTTEKYTRLGRIMINTLLSDPEGAQYLAEDKLLPQIADCLLQLEPVRAPV